MATAQSVLLECPERYGTADDGMQRDRSEVASVERRRFIPIHEEHLVARQGMATLPNGEHASAVVALAGHAHFDAVDSNGGAGAAHGSDLEARECA